MDDTSIAPTTFAERLNAALDRARLVVDALANVPAGLPEPDDHYIRRDGSVDLCFDSHRKSGPEHAVATWGNHFGTKLVLDLSSASGYLLTVVELADAVSVRVDTWVTSRRAYELGAMLQIPVSPGGQVQIIPAVLLAALAADAGTRVTS